MCMAGESSSSAGRPIQDSSEQTPVNGKKLNEILELLRSQLESQQRQLALLQGLTKSVVAEETPNTQANSYTFGLYTCSRVDGQRHPGYRAFERTWEELYERMC
jgi:hypothetical protein